MSTMTRSLIAVQGDDLCAVGMRATPCSDHVNVRWEACCCCVAESRQYIHQPRRMLEREKTRPCVKAAFCSCPILVSTRERVAQGKVIATSSRGRNAEMYFFVNEM